MRRFLLVGILCSSVLAAKAQSTVTSGNWSDPSVWSTVAVPLASSASVTVSNPLTIDYNDGGGGIDPSAGTWTFNANATDQPGGTAYQFNPTGGSITIASGVTVTFEGSASFSHTTLLVYGTLIVGPMTIANSNSPKNNIVIEPGGTLIVNGDLTDNDNSGTFNINGTAIVYGNFYNATGSVTVGGTGIISTTGTLSSNGGSTIMGTGNDCTHGPCSSTTLACTFDNYISPTTKTVCASSSPTVSFTANSGSTNPPTSPSYQWQSSTDNITFSNVGTNSSSYTTPTLTQTTYVRLAITASSCTSTSATTTITVLSSGGWIGSTSNDWGTASNWCAGVPTSSTDVTISNASGVANMPTINAGTAALCRNLIINSTSPASSVTLAASSTASLSIFGNFTNNGTFTDNSTAASAGVKLVGNVAQTIAGTTQNTFNNLTIANTSGATPAINVTTNNLVVNSNLTLTSGMVNLNGYTVTLGTAAASAGTLAYSSQWFYGGNFQRWFPATSITVGNVAGQFPIGTSSDYRPMFLGNGGLTAGGTIKVSHSSVAGSTTVSFADGASTVAVRSNSYWTVSTANGIGTGTHNMQTYGTGFGLVGNVTDLRQTLSGGVVGTAGTNANTTTNPQVNRTGLTTANLSNNFFWGSVNAGTSPLPIKLTGFTGLPQPHGVDLQWQTATEVNNDFFTVWHASADGHFIPVGTTKGNGTTNETHSYSLTDYKPVIGTNYYQLRQTDFDGNTTRSETIAVEVTRLESLAKIYPNPVGRQQTLNVEIGGLVSNSTVELQIVSLQGVSVKRVISQTDPNGTLQNQLAIDTLPSGLYFVKVEGVHFKLIVE